MCNETVSLYISADMALQSTTGRPLHSCDNACASPLSPNVSARMAAIQGMRLTPLLHDYQAHKQAPIYLRFVDE